MSKETPTDMIFELIQWIDHKRVQKENPLFQSNDAIKGEMKKPTIALVALPLVVGIIVYEYGINLVFQGAYDYRATITAISASLPALTVLIAGFALFKPDFEKNTLKIRYGRALESRKKDVESGNKEKDFTDNEKLALWSLIELASKNDPFTLMQLYNADKSRTVFTEKKLLERLCK